MMDGNESEALLKKTVKLFELDTDIKLIYDERRRELVFDRDKKCWYLFIPKGSLSHIIEFIAKIKLAELTTPLLVQTSFKNEEGISDVISWFGALKDPIVFAWSYKIMKHYLSADALHKELMILENEYNYYNDQGNSDPLLTFSIALVRLAVGLEDHLEIEEQSDPLWESYVRYCKNVINEPPSLEALLEIPSVMEQPFEMTYNPNEQILEIVAFSDY
jgi:hypothetical protein